MFVVVIGSTVLKAESFAALVEPFVVMAASFVARSVDLICSIYFLLIVEDFHFATLLLYPKL
ncbi:hypothetical protein, partial [Lysinibacillus sp. D4B2_S17]|uniref:hypothetical protein n=1 Tax=Lysinibacillus sp. D4B2_S17 TaxID=2941225 RepID=UPI0020BEE59B